MLTLLTVSLAGALYCSYLVALRIGFRNVGKHARKTRPREDIHFSVVVAARNEADRIGRLLDALANQTHTQFEAVIADDGSDDDTAQIVQLMAKRDPRFRLVRVLNPRFPRKKHALTKAISAARHDQLALTDADCVPEPEWLETLSRYCTGREVVVTGFAPMRRTRSALSLVVRYETFLTAFLTAGAAGLGRPFMAVGRNLSYDRWVFERIGGFEHSEASLSGDDDLLVQEISRRGAGWIVYMADRSGFVVSDAPRSWGAWVRQKRRHASAGRYYRWDAKAHLMLFHLSNAVLWASPILLGWTGIAVLAAKWSVQGSLFRRPAKHLDQLDLIPYLPAADLAYLLYSAFVATSGVIARPSEW